MDDTGICCWIITYPSISAGCDSGAGDNINIWGMFKWLILGVTMTGCFYVDSERKWCWLQENHRWFKKLGICNLLCESKCRGGCATTTWACSNVCQIACFEFSIDPCPLSVLLDVKAFAEQVSSRTIFSAFIWAEADAKQTQYFWQELKQFLAIFGVSL